MLIGQLEGAVWLPTKAIRSAEQIGFLPKAERRPNGYRDDEDRRLVEQAGR